MVGIVADIVEGWTAEVGPFTLKADGVAIDLTGFIASQILALVRKVGETTYVPTTGDMRIDDDPATGKVYWSPDAIDFPTGSFGTYEFRFKVTDGDGKVAFFPNGAAQQIRVFKP